MQGYANCPTSPQVKELELSNPARKAIAYTARLEGHPDFSTDASIVRIDARGTVRFPLKCSPSTSVPAESRLVLASKRDGGGAHAATLVFLLRCVVNTRAPLKRLRTEGPLYEMQQFEVTVTNPYEKVGGGDGWCAVPLPLPALWSFSDLRDLDGCYSAGDAVCAGAHITLAACAHLHIAQSCALLALFIICGTKPWLLAHAHPPTGLRLCAVAAARARGAPAPTRRRQAKAQGRCGSPRQYRQQYNQQYKRYSRQYSGREAGVPCSFWVGQDATSAQGGGE